MKRIKQFLIKFKRTYLCRHKWTMLNSRMKVSQGGVRISFCGQWPHQIAYEGDYRILLCAKCGANHLVEDVDAQVHATMTENGIQ